MIPEAVRTEIVQSLRAGETQSAIARRLGVARGTVNTLAGRLAKDQPLKLRVMALTPRLAEIKKLIAEQPSLSAHDIAARYGVTPPTAHRFLKRHGIAYAYKKPSNYGNSSFMPDSNES